MSADTDLLYAHFLVIDLMNIFGLLSTAIHKNWPVKKTFYTDYSLYSESSETVTRTLFTM